MYGDKVICFLRVTSLLSCCLCSIASPSGEVDAQGQTPLAAALAQCAASGEECEVAELLQAAEQKVKARQNR
jgi:hypothetical protein